MFLLYQDRKNRQISYQQTIFFFRFFDSFVERNIKNPDKAINQKI